MSKAPHSLRHLIWFAVIIAASCSAQTNAFVQFGGMIAQDADSPVFLIRTPMPLGAEAYRLKPIGKPFYLLACVEDQRFDGLHVSRVRGSQSVVDASGQPWQNYPSQMTFRVTATGVADLLTNLDSADIDEPGDLNSLFLGLKFRLKVYHGLNLKIIQPASARMIGVPADVPSEERVFRVSFDTKDIPVDDRLVLEVLSPTGQLLSRFHLELL